MATVAPEVKTYINELKTKHHAEIDQLKAELRELKSGPQLIAINSPFSTGFTFTLGACFAMFAVFSIPIGFLVLVPMLLNPGAFF